MLEVHAAAARSSARKEEGDPIPPVAAALADEARLLAFDEMVVNNIADAMIMSRLFTALIEAGVTVVTTSNRPPRDLYKDGLNREHFLPFIALIEERLDVLAAQRPDRLPARPARRRSTPGYVPNGAEATAAACATPSSA